MPFEPVAGHAERFNAKEGKIWKSVKDTEASFYAAALLLGECLKAGDLLQKDSTSNVLVGECDAVVKELHTTFSQDVQLGPVQTLESLAYGFEEVAYPRVLQQLCGTLLKQCAVAKADCSDINSKLNHKTPQKDYIFFVLNAAWWLQHNRIKDFYQLCLFAPACFGVQYRQTTNENEPTATFEVVLKDLSAECRLPCVMDLKLGTRYDAPWTKPCRIAELQNKAELCSSAALGVRVTGMKGSTSSGVMDVVDRAEGYAIKSYDDVEGAIRRYINLCEASKRTALVDYFLEELQKIRRWQETQKLCQLRQSSILFVFDSAHRANPLEAIGPTFTVGDENVPQHCSGSCIQISDHSDHKDCGAFLKMIDFTYVLYTDDGETGSSDVTDAGYMQGLKTVIEILENLLEKKPV